MYVMMVVVFVLGYLAIALEHNIHVDKAASALLTATILWTLLVLGADTLLAGHVADVASHVAGGGDGGNGMDVSALLNVELRHHLSEIAEILFFLMGAMVIVELIDAHDGFEVITRRIATTSAVSLLWIIGGLTFFLSALLDNLTTTIVMVSLLRKLVDDKQLRWWYVGLVVVCANAGGAWSPIGDVTTTMLWIGHQITANRIIVDLILPSLVAAFVPLAVLSMMLKGKQVVRPIAANNAINNAISNAVGNAINNTHQMTANHMVHNNISNNISNNTPNNVTGNTNHPTNTTTSSPISPAMRQSVLALGLSALAFVPVFKTITHLPPYMGILFGVGVLWVFTEIKHRHHPWEVKKRLTVVGVLAKVDMPSILFFLGILLAVSSLATSGHLGHMGAWLDANFGNLYVINVLIGLLSSLVDNVPLVAGAMKMYPLLTPTDLAGLTGDELARQSQFVQDGAFWHFLAYCAGTGGSCLIIGSAAGVAAMGMEKIPFTWYLKRISGLALLGYLAGAAVYMVVHVLL